MAVILYALVERASHLGAEIVGGPATPYGEPLRRLAALRLFVS